MTDSKRRIQIQAGDVEERAVLNDSPTADEIWDALPIQAKVNRWGEEIYCSIPVQCPAEDSVREAMAVGEVAYWPPGTAFCIFFGPTPASSGAEPRAASPVNPVGTIEGDATRFARVPDGASILLERA